jgi:hypothetical protein
MSMIESDFHPPANAWYTEMDLKMDKEVVPMVIGRGGAVFKAITKRAKVDFIWYYNDTGKIGVWCSSKHTSEIKALDRMNNAIDRIIDRKYMMEERLSSSSERSLSLPSSPSGSIPEVSAPEPIHPYIKL